MLDIGEEPPPVGAGDEAVILKVLVDENGDHDLMVWTRSESPDNVLIMLAAAIQVIVANAVRVDDHERD